MLQLFEGEKIEKVVGLLTVRTVLREKKMFENVVGLLKGCYNNPQGKNRKCCRSETWLRMPLDGVVGL